MTASWRREVEYVCALHDEFGPLYSLLQKCRDGLLTAAFSDWDVRFEEEDIPILSLEAEPQDNPAGRWLGKFQDIGPLGFSNVISLNLMAFQHGAEIPATLAHEMCHWWDRPNTGHTNTFWSILEMRCGLTESGLKTMQWVRLEEYFPMEDLSEVVLNV